MKTIEKIISEHGGMDALQRGEAIRVCNEENKTLIVEYMGRSPTGKDAVSVSIFDKKESGVIVSPEMSFEVDYSGWTPYYFRDEEKEEEHFVFTYAEKGKRRLIGINMEAKRRLVKIALELDDLLREKGYLEAGLDSLYYPLFDNYL